MTTRDLIRLVQRKLWLIALVTLVTVGVVAGVLALRPEPVPEYRSSSTLRLSSAGKATNFDRAQFTYAELARSKVVLVELIRQLDLAASPTDLEDQISVGAIPGTELIRVEGRSPDPEQAVAIANTLANILVENDRASRPSNSQTALLESEAKVAQDLLIQDKAALQLLLLNYRVIQPGEQEALQNKIAIEEKAYEDLTDRLVESRVADALNANSLTIYEPALSVELVPNNNQAMLLLTLAAVTGLMGGFGLAFLQETMDNRVRSSQEIEQKMPLPVLAQIPRMPRNVQGNLDEMAVTESFRALQAYVWSGMNGQAGGLKTVMVASPSPREGKSFVVARMATALASTGRSVILVDMDLRRPTVHTQFGLQNTAGVSDLLVNLPAVARAGDGQIQANAHAASPLWGDEDTVVHPAKLLRPTRFPGLRVLTTGPLPTNPIRLITPERMKTLLQRLAAQADVVLFDSPALLGLADSLILGPLMDGVIVVASAGTSTQDNLDRATELLKRVHANVLGIVLNRAKIESRSVYHYYKQSADMTARSNLAHGTPDDHAEKVRSASPAQRRPNR